MKLEIWVCARNKPFVFSLKKDRLTTDIPTRETEHFLRPGYKQARKYQICSLPSQEASLEHLIFDESGKSF